MLTSLFADYFFWSIIQTKVYEGRREPFQNLEELHDRIVAVWAEAVDLPVLQKAIDQFLPRLRAVVENGGRSIKTRFG